MFTPAERKEIVQALSEKRDQVQAQMNMHHGDRSHFQRRVQTITRALAKIKSSQGYAA